MATIVCAADGRIKEAFYGARAAYDPADIVLTVPEVPRDVTGWWWDGATGLRAATAEERAVYQADAQARRERIEFDEQKMLRALAQWTAGKLGIPIATAKAEILAIYRSL